MAGNTNLIESREFEVKFCYDLNCTKALMIAFDIFCICDTVCVCVLFFFKKKLPQTCL